MQPRLQPHATPERLQPYAIRAATPCRGKQAARSDILPAPRREEHAVAIGAGMAYALWGKGRWKMNHNATVQRYRAGASGTRGPANGEVTPIDGLQFQQRPVARCAVTFRYYRRSWALLEATAQSSAQSSAPRAPPSGMLPFELLGFVDALSYGRRGTEEQRGEYPYAYPAVVLHVDAARRVLWLNYVSDGLGREDDEEASILAQVPWACAVPSSRDVKRRCYGIPATQRIVNTHRLLQAFIERACTLAVDGGCGVGLVLPWRDDVLVPRGCEASAMRYATLRSRLQPYVTEAATLCDRGCSPMRSRLHPYGSRMQLHVCCRYTEIYDALAACKDDESTGGKTRIEMLLEHDASE